MGAVERLGWEKPTSRRRQAVLLHNRRVLGADDGVVFRTQGLPQFVHDPAVELLVEGRLRGRSRRHGHVHDTRSPPGAPLGLNGT